MRTLTHKTNRLGPSRRPIVLLCVLLFLVYLSNLRFIFTGDTIPTRFLPFSLLLKGHLYLDDWIQPYLHLPLLSGPYFVTQSRHHWMSSYPILTPLLVTPLYLAPAWWISQQPHPLAPESMQFVAQAMEKISAALLAILSAGMLYLALRNVTSQGASLLITLIYALASSTWSVSSQALWTHGLTELSLAFLLWALLGDPTARGYAFWVGLALAAAVVNKPPNALLALALLIYFVRKERQKLFLVSVPLLILGSLLLAYNLYFFGNLLGAYPGAFRTMGYGSVAEGFRGSIWEGIAGFLVSPSRGLFVYMPWTIFALWGSARLWRENKFGWERYLIAGTAALFLFYAKLERWWGGYCFGPRYLTDLLPLVAFFLVPLWPALGASRLLRTVFVLATVAALWVQVVGAYYYPNGDWDTQPVPVDERPERVWNLSDNQLRRTWQAGPAHSRIVQRWQEFWSRRKVSGQSEFRFQLELPLHQDVDESMLRG